MVTRRQLLDAGLTARQVEGWLRSGRLHRVHRGVYVVGRPELSDHGRFMSAVLAVGDDAVLSHRSAAALWELRPWPTWVVELTAPNGALRPRIIAHRAGVDGADRDEVERIPTTTVPRTLLDLAEVVPSTELERAIHQAYRRRLFQPRAVTDCIAAHPSRNGAARLRRALADHPEGVHRSRSWLEVTMLDLCRKHHLPLPRVNVHLAGRERDFYWPDHNLVVETDGREEHLTPIAFEDDHERDTLLMEAGYKVRRFTYRQLTERPDWVAARIRAALAA